MPHNDRVQPQSYDEWRVCGQSERRGPWEGGWERGEITANRMYEIRRLAENNDEVWIEHRTVTIGNQRREEIE